MNILAQLFGARSAFAGQPPPRQPTIPPQGTTGDIQWLQQQPNLWQLQNQTPLPTLTTTTQAQPTTTSLPPAPEALGLRAMGDVGNRAAGEPISYGVPPPPPTMPLKWKRQNLRRLDRMLKDETSDPHAGALPMLELLMQYGAITIENGQVSTPGVSGTPRTTQRLLDFIHSLR